MKPAEGDGAVGCGVDAVGGAFVGSLIFLGYRCWLVLGAYFFFLRLLELIMLCDYITRGYGDHPPLTIVVPWGSRPKEGVTHGGKGR